MSRSDAFRSCWKIPVILRSTGLELRERRLCSIPPHFSALLEIIRICEAIERMKR